MQSNKITQRACRQFSYQVGQSFIDVKVLELLDPDFGLYVWPSALVLAEYISFRIDLFSGTPNRPKGILELGAGTALPSILLTKAATDSFVIITDRPDVPQILINVQEALKENGIRTLYPNDPSAKVLVRSLNWGDFTFKGKGDDDVGGLLQLLDDVCLQQIDSNNNDSKAPLEHIDIILGSDVFYNPQDFDSLLATVSYIINQHNPDCVFLTTYQNRSAKRNIDHLLRKWGLEGREINWEDFDFNMSKFIGDDESDDGGGHESGESGHESNDDEGTNNEDRINDMDWDPSIKFERKESKLETVAQSSTKVSKVPLVDYRSSSEEEEEEEEVERERDEIDENQKEDRYSRDRMKYKISDGGPLSSVHLLWICKSGYKNRFWRWKKPSMKK